MTWLSPMPMPMLLMTCCFGRFIDIHAQSFILCMAVIVLHPTPCISEIGVTWKWRAHVNAFWFRVDTGRECLCLSIVNYWNKYFVLQVISSYFIFFTSVSPIAKRWIRAAKNRRIWLWCVTMGVVNVLFLLIYYGGTTCHREVVSHGLS